MVQKECLIIIDCQNDFLDGGSLEIKNSMEIIPTINFLIKQNYKKNNLIIASKDFHPVNHCSFASSHPGKNNFEFIKLNNVQHQLWPEHCIANTFGSEFPTELNSAKISHIFKKGQDANVESYSVFKDVYKSKATDINELLKINKITKIQICGVALDLCVFYSAMDAVNLGYDVEVILNATASISKHNAENKKKLMKKNGVAFLNV